MLADVLWYAQQTYKPAGIIDLATLTGAIIIGLGHEKAGVFSNDDAFCARSSRRPRPRARAPGACPGRGL